MAEGDTLLLVYPSSVSTQYSLAVKKTVTMPHLGSRGLGCRTINDGNMIFRAEENKYIVCISNPNCGRLFKRTAQLDYSDLGRERDRKFRS